MWELIRANKRRSLILFAAMGICLLALGGTIGYAVVGPDRAVDGVFIAAGIWFLLSLVSYFQGDSILLSISGARQVTHDVHPQLFNVVEEMRIASNLPAMPKVYIIPEPSPNAFATGRNPQRSSIAVTAGLLSKLNRDQLQGVIAHEMSHILNRDILFMTMAGVMLGSIVMISEVFLRGMFYSGRGRRYSSGRSGKGNAQGQAVIMIVALVLAILAPILARLLYFAISRRREYLADATGVRLTRYPEGLASALEVISKNSSAMESVNKVTAPMFIVNPLKNALSTHPPIEERVRILRGMGNGANYRDYQRAYSAVAGGAAIIPASGMAQAENIPVRKATAEQPIEGAKKNARDVGDLMRAVNKYAFLACACGLKIKVPPDYHKHEVNCPRCGRELAVPVAEMAAIGAMAGSLGTQKKAEAQVKPEKLEPVTYKRKGKGWETFNCTCGNLLQISPIFSATHIECSNCGRKINIKK